MRVLSPFPSLAAHVELGIGEEQIRFAILLPGFEKTTCVIKVKMAQDHFGDLGVIDTNGFQVFKQDMVDSCPP